MNLICHICQNKIVTPTEGYTLQYWSGPGAVTKKAVYFHKICFEMEAGDEYKLSSCNVGRQEEDEVDEGDMCIAGLFQEELKKLILNETRKSFRKGRP